MRGPQSTGLSCWRLSGQSPPSNPSLSLTASSLMQTTLRLQLILSNISETLEKGQNNFNIAFSFLYKILIMTL